MSTSRKVPLLDTTRSLAPIRAELVKTFERVLDSGQYIMGAEVEAFERECAAAIGAKHAIAVSSGTDALILALMALGIGAGDEVICPTYTFFATAGSIWRVGAKPVFVDIEPASFNLDAAEVKRKITSRTKAVMPVHLYGQAAACKPLLGLGVPVIEDAAQAIGAHDGDKQAGTQGAFGCFSFFPSKNLGAFGDAGLLTTNDDALAKTARRMRVHGMEPKYFHHEVGGNFRIDALQAALLRVKLPLLDAATAARQRNAALFDELLPKQVGKPARVQAHHTYNQYVIRVPDGRRDALRAFLQERGVASEIYYPVPLHLQQCFASLGHKTGDFPHAERAAAETLALPIFPELTREELNYIVEQIAAFFA